MVEWIIQIMQLQHETCSNILSFLWNLRGSSIHVIHSDKLIELDLHLIYNGCAFSKNFSFYFPSLTIFSFGVSKLHKVCTHYWFSLPLSSTAPAIHSIQRKTALTSPRSSHNQNKHWANSYITTWNCTLPQHLKFVIEIGFQLLSWVSLASFSISSSSCYLSSFSVFNFNAASFCWSWYRVLVRQEVFWLKQSGQIKI